MYTRLTNEEQIKLKKNIHKKGLDDELEKTINRFHLMYRSGTIKYHDYLEAYDKTLLSLGD
jgi:hypothetical protein